MPTFKKGLLNPLTAAESPLEAERRVVDSLLQSKVGMKDTTLVRYAGVPTTVTYFQQLTGGENDYLTNLNSLNDVDVNMKLFRRIDDFPIVIKGEIQPEQEGDTSLGISLEANGVGAVLPRTLKPGFSDAFVMKQYDRICLFRVKNVTPKTFENDSGFEIEFALETDSFRMESHPIAKCIAEVWKFEYRHVGTGLRSLYRSEEYDVLRSLRELYNELSEEYLTKFYQKVLNTFLFEPKVDIPAPSPFTLLDPPKEMEDTPMSDAVQEAKGRMLSYAGKKLYDRELLHFIKSNSIFYNSDNIIHPTAFFESRHSVYKHTIFGVIESKNLSDLSLHYQVPTPLNVATIGYPPQLYGKIDLSWTPSLTAGCLDLLPQNFAMKIRTSSVEARSGYDKNYYSNFIDVLIETISAYIKGKGKDSSENRILDRLVYIKSNENLLGDIPDQEKFYVYPLLAKVVIEMMAELAKEQANTSSNDPEKGA